MRPSDKVVQKKSIIIAPFCILHHDDRSTSTYYGYVNYPTRIRSSDGVEHLKCTDLPRQYGSWKVYYNFYAFSPMIRPIPNGLKLINASKHGVAPYNTKTIKYTYDPFNIQQGDVSFITWNQPVPGTVPLYLHITPLGDSYPSFDKNPPGDDKTGWTEREVSPLYVLVNPNTHPSKVDANAQPFPKWKIDKHGKPIFRFRGTDGRCIPDVNGVSIEECFLDTDDDILHTKHSLGPTPLLTRLRLTQEGQKSVGQNISGFFKNISPYVITLCISSFILALVACIIILSK
jgi:hypothetical protein